MKIIVAEHLGMCFGVRDAIALAEKESEKAPLTIYGELVHNQTVIKALETRGIKVEKELSRINTPKLMITAHGTSEQTLENLKQRGFDVIEATCPLVRFAHGSLKKLVRQGYYPIIVGKRDHVEVQGLVGDLEEYSVILRDEDIALIPAKERYGVVSQTTQPYARTQYLIRLLRLRFTETEIKAVDTVCQPTKQRQKAAEDLAKACTVVIVIGGAQSNNTRELVETCSRFCPRVHHVTHYDEVNFLWFTPEDTVGITAGTSTPDNQIQALHEKIKSMGLPGGS